MSQYRTVNLGIMLVCLVINIIILLFDGKFKKLLYAYVVVISLYLLGLLLEINKVDIAIIEAIGLIIFILIENKIKFFWSKLSVLGLGLVIFLIMANNITIKLDIIGLIASIIGFSYLEKNYKSKYYSFYCAIISAIQWMIIWDGVGIKNILVQGILFLFGVVLTYFIVFIKLKLNAVVDERTIVAYKVEN